MKFPNKDHLIVLFCFLLLLSEGCKRSVPDRDEEIQITAGRFERDLFGIDIYNLRDSIGYLKDKYPGFFPIFTGNILGARDTNLSAVSDIVVSFVTDFTIYRVSKRVEEIFPDMKYAERQLSDAFSGYKSFFPEKIIPDVITCITGFNQSIIIADSLVAISLDKYLGPNDDFYKLLYPPVPAYARYQMRPEKIPSDVMLGWILTEYTYNAEKNNLVSNMIYYGRANYLVRKLMPELSDTLLWGFTGKQMKFAVNNEKNMWEFLVEQKRLFSTDGFLINQYVNEAPFTKDFTGDSPGRVALWIGYKIVDSYMKKNRDVTIKQLMEETDYQKILNLSKYNP